MGFLKPKPAKSTSENVNNDLIKSTYGGQMQSGVGATNFLSQLLGLTPARTNQIGSGLNQIAEAGGAQAGYNNYLQNAGYAPAMRELSRAVTGQMASSGLLRSGASAKALQTRGTELNQSFFNNFLQQLAGLSGLGLQAGGLVANTGQKSTNTAGSPSLLGTLASTIGGIASIFPSKK